MTGFEAARSVTSLAASLGLLGDGARPGPGALGVLWAVHVAFRSLDRLEVRGRDSAGLHLMLAGHGLDLASRAPGPRSGRGRRPAVHARWPSGRRMAACPSFTRRRPRSASWVTTSPPCAEPWATDPLLARALASPDVRATVVAHTRWASVGLISQANAHPLNSDEVGGRGRRAPYVIGALNGDVDNYAELWPSESVAVPAEVTTDAKLVPTLVSRYLAAGGSRPRRSARRWAVSRVRSVSPPTRPAFPDELLLALRGSGQSLNIGLAEDAFVVASEPYGLVEETSRYLRMDGEGGGQVVRCSRTGRGDARRDLHRWRYDGTDLPVGEDEVKVAEITTRDVDRRGFKHFLLKEISESPLSVRKTLRGKLVPGENGRFVVRLGDDVIPARSAPGPFVPAASTTSWSSARARRP